MSAKLQVLHASGRGFLIRRGGDIVIVIRHSRVGPGVGIITPAAIKGRSSCPVAGGYR